MRGKNFALADADALTTYADETAAIVLVGQASNDAVESVLRQCGLAWFGNDVKEVTD